MEYNYIKNVKEDVKTAILDNYTREEIAQNLEDKESREDFEIKLHDDLWVDDSVTGNASGSYTCNAYQAEKYLCHNWDLLIEALEAFGDDVGEAIKRGQEYCDVTIRCYLLSEAISSALDELEEEI